MPRRTECPGRLAFPRPHDGVVAGDIAAIPPARFDAFRQADDFNLAMQWDGLRQ
jgi:hypothetical protein